MRTLRGGVRGPGKILHPSAEIQYIIYRWAVTTNSTTIRIPRPCLEMPTGHLATWSDLPTEIVEQILVYLDPCSLLVLAKLNRFLNCLALEQFFGSNIRHIQVHGLVPPFPHPESLILRGLCLALWLDDVAELDQGIDGDLEYSTRQLRRLITFVNRLHSLKALRVRASIILPIWGWRGQRVEGDLLVRELHKLVEIALNKGCQKLRIEGNSIPHCRLSSAGIRSLQWNCAAPTRIWRWMKPWILHPFGQKTTCLSRSPSSDINFSSRPPDNIRVPHLTECVLRKPAFLGTMALPYIVNLLQQNAETITYLDMNCYGLTGSYYKARALSIALFHNIHLPRLDTLILTFQVSTISTNSFAWFLSRHSSISVLRINDPSTLPRQPALIPSKRYQSFLPNLKTLDLPSRVVEWLLFSNIEIPDGLESVTIHASSGPDNLESLGNAIRSLRQWMGHVGTLTLDANWWCYGLTLEDHGHDRLGGQEVSRFLDVRKLIFLLGGRPYYTNLCSRRLAGSFIHVVKLFPTIIELEIRLRGAEERLQDGEKMKEVLMAGCPNLKLVQC